MDKILFTAKEAAQMLSMSRAFFYKLVSEGRIKKIKIGRGSSGAVRFRPADLDAFVKAHTKTN